MNISEIFKVDRVGLDLEDVMIVFGEELGRMIGSEWRPVRLTTRKVGCRLEGLYLCKSVECGSVERAGWMLRVRD